MSTRDIVRRMLTEKADAPVPEYFYLALDFGLHQQMQERTLASLMAGRLEGVKGIGASSIQDMIMDWGHVREILLRLPGDELADLNDLSLVRYDDPAYLMANNMEVLGRLFNSPNDSQQVLTKMNSYVIKALKKYGAEQQAYDFQYGAELQAFGHWVRKSDFQINSVEDMTRGFLQYLDEASKSEDYYIRDRARRLDYGQPGFPKASEWTRWFHQGVRNMGALYAAEVEWAVKGGVLTVPESTEIWVVSPEPRYMEVYRTWKRTGKLPVLGMGWEEIMAEVDGWHDSVNKLRSKYASVKAISQARLKKEQKKLWARRGGKF